MDTTPLQLRQQLARDYTRDRIRGAEDRRAARFARASRRDQHLVDVAPTPVAAVRRWWTVPARPTPA